MRRGSHPVLRIETGRGASMGMVLHDPAAVPRLIAALAPHVPRDATWTVVPARDAATEPPAGEASPSGG